MILVLSGWVHIGLRLSWQLAPQVTLLADQQPATVMICGIQAPSMGRRPPLPEGSPADAPPPDPVPDPFAREAKHFTEVRPNMSFSRRWPHPDGAMTPVQGWHRARAGRAPSEGVAPAGGRRSHALASTLDGATGAWRQVRVLNREVRVVLEGIDKHNNLLGSLVYPEADTVVDLGNQLVSRGLAKVSLPSPPARSLHFATQRGWMAGVRLVGTLLVALTHGEVALVRRSCPA